MGSLILCHRKKAKHPYEVSRVHKRIYTIEELCYYLCNKEMQMHEHDFHCYTRGNDGIHGLYLFQTDLCRCWDFTDIQYR